MEKRRLLWMALLLLYGILPARAQWDASLSQYWATRSYSNPSFTGEKEAIRTTALYRSPWNGIEHAPRQFLLTADMPFEFMGERHGTGIVAYTETAGTLRNSLMGVQYSFKKEIGSGFLNIGLQAGIYDLDFDAGSRRFVGDSLSSNQGALEVASADKQLFDLGAGISWTGQHFFAGLSILHINQPRFHVHDDGSGNPGDAVNLANDSLTSRIFRSYNLMAGYNIRLFPTLELQPMVWLQSTSQSARLQATLRVEYNKKFSGGMSWRMDEGYAFFAGTTLHGVEVGYAYDLYTGGIGKESKGSHELYLRYDLPLDHFKPKRQPHKSIRLL